MFLGPWTMLIGLVIWHYGNTLLGGFKIVYPLVAGSTNMGGAPAIETLTNNTLALVLAAGSAYQIYKYATRNQFRNCVCGRHGHNWRDCPATRNFARLYTTLQSRGVDVSKYVDYLKQDSQIDLRAFGEG